MSTGKFNFHEKTWFQLVSIFICTQDYDLTFQKDGATSHTTQATQVYIVSKSISLKKMKRWVATTIPKLNLHGLLCMEFNKRMCKGMSSFNKKNGWRLNIFRKPGTDIFERYYKCHISLGKEIATSLCLICHFTHVPSSFVKFICCIMILRSPPTTCVEIEKVSGRLYAPKSGYKENISFLPPVCLQKLQKNHSHNYTTKSC